MEVRCSPSCCSPSPPESPDGCPACWEQQSCAPHLLGPFIARRLDTAGDGRRVIAVSALAHGLLLEEAGLLLLVTWTVVPALLLVLSGVFGPMLTGGASSRLLSIAGPSQESQRRAQGWDVASYGVSGMLGPAVVAWISAATGPLGAMLILAASTLIGAGAVFALPKQAPAAESGAVTSSARVLMTIWRSRPLRCTLGAHGRGCVLGCGATDLRRCRRPNSWWGCSGRHPGCWVWRWRPCRNRTVDGVAAQGRRRQAHIATGRSGRRSAGRRHTGVKPRPDDDCVHQCRYC